MPADTSAARTAAGEATGLALRCRAAAPATCGVAMDVPLIVFVAVVPVYQADVMLEPGANRSRQVPKFENDERASVLVVAPTVTAAATRDGEPLQALVFSLPAATAKVTPALIALPTAVSRAEEGPPPRLMLATAGLTCFCRTQSTPAMTPELVPEPSQPSTRTGCTTALSAMPYLEPAAVPATCVPWPLQSVALPPAVTAS